MPRKTGYTTRSASSTLRLGDPDLGTTTWDTEYDVEFTATNRREEGSRIAAAQASARASLRTPRSLKKGYVAGQDYEKLGAQYSDALLAYRDLLAQVDVLEQRMASMAGNEHLLLRAVEDQHALIDTLRQQVATMTESLGLLLGGVERNKSILALMSDAAAQVPSPHKPTRVVELGHGGSEAAAHNPVSVSARLSTLEARIGDMADAVAALARAQTLMAHGAVTPAGRAAAGREGPAAVGSRRQSSTGRESSGGRRHVAERHVAERHVAEKIEKLPNPVHLLSTRGSSWKP